MKYDASLGGGIHRNLFEKIISVDNLFDAWREFVKGKRNRYDVQEFGYHIEDKLFALHGQLVADVWCHGSYERFLVCDPKPRIIHKASVADRLVHHAIFRCIEPLFEPSFIFDSWSCRTGKGTLRSVLRLHDVLSGLNRRDHKPLWVLKCDIRKFFASVDQDVLIKMIAKQLQDSKAVVLITSIIRSFPVGLPLGNLTSQLFANVYLNPFDHFMKEQLHCKYYMRYCDDFVFASFDRKYLRDALFVIDEWLTQNLHLTLHPLKIHLRHFHHGIDWLGYVLYPWYRLVRPSTKRRLMNRINEGVFEVLRGEMSEDDFSSILVSYQALVGHSQNKDLLKLLTQLENSL